MKNLKNWMLSMAAFSMVSSMAMAGGFDDPVGVSQRGDMNAARNDVLAGSIPAAQGKHANWTAAECAANCDAGDVAGKSREGGELKKAYLCALSCKSTADDSASIKVAARTVFRAFRNLCREGGKYDGKVAKNQECNEMSIFGNSVMNYFMSKPNMNFSQFKDACSEAYSKYSGKVNKRAISKVKTAEEIQNMNDQELRAYVIYLTKQLKNQ